MADEAKRRPKLVFVSPQFLFPNDTGGRIRTTNILRGLKGGAFEIVLVCMASAEQLQRWAKEIDGVCDEFIAWAPSAKRPNWRRVIDLLGDLPANVVVDKSVTGLAAVESVLARPGIDLVVFDFVHSAVLMPERLRTPSVCFTHNVEAEIFRRHALQAKDAARRAVWTSQSTKMERFEGDSLRRFDTVIAVSERDASHFRERYQLAHVQAIPTGVDLDFFHWKAAPAIDAAAAPPTVVFTGSMDWDANIDGIRFFLQQVWPRVLLKQPQAQFKVVGRSPPAALLQLAQQTRNVEFTGRVDDVRPYVWNAHAFVIPLLVGGGTRIKAFEAMGMGCPIVSTAIGMEGLDAEPELHFMQRDDAEGLADAVLTVLGDAALRERMSKLARQLVEQRFGHQVAAGVFEQICLDTLARRETLVPEPATA